MIIVVVVVTENELYSLVPILSDSSVNYDGCGSRHLWLSRSPNCLLLIASIAN